MVPYKVFSHFSIGQAFGKPSEYIAEAKRLKLRALALTDIDSVSGVVEFLQGLDGSDILPIVGSYVTTPQGRLLLLCKNKVGWHNLVRILGEGSTDEQGFSVAIDRIQEFTDGLIAVVGGVDSVGSDFVSNYLKDVDCFFSIENDESIERVNDIRAAAAQNNTPIITGRPVFYAVQADKICQEILQCSHAKLTLADAKPPKIQRFFDGSYSLSDCPENNDSDILLSKIERFSVGAAPMIPIAQDDLGNQIVDSDKTLKTICQQGWVSRGISKIKNTDPALYKVYSERIKDELDVFTQAKISNYLLLVRDIIVFCRAQGWLTHPRGSAGGCLISYLSGVTDVDPVRPDPTLPYAVGRELIFSRFINKGRFLGGKNSLPDIDVDVPISARTEIIQYLKDKYGDDCVGHIVTFNRLDGRGAVKEVFRTTNPVANSYDVADAITKEMPDKAKIQDDLESIRQSKPGYTTVNYAMDYCPNIAQYIEDYKYEFDIASRITDTISHTGQHAAGIVVASQPLKELFPTCVSDKTGELMVALEMADAEYVGCVKFDLLGVSAYEKLGAILAMINGNLEEAVVGI